MLWTTPALHLNAAEAAPMRGKTASARIMGLTAPPPPIIQNSMVNTGLKGDSGVRIRGKIGKAAIAAVVAASTFGLCSPLFAQERRESSTVVVYGDASRDWVAEVQRFADILDPRDRPFIIAGDGITPLPRNVTLVWFGDLSHEPSETAGAPEALRVVADHLGRDVRDGSAGLAKGEVRLDANCYTQSLGRADGLPEIAVNFSGEDPQSFCKGLTISSLLGKHGRWMRNDETECLLPNCATIRTRE